MLANLLIGVAAIAFGLLVAFRGYPLFRFILPVLGLFYGFMLGNALFGSWHIGVIAGVVIAAAFAFAAYTIWSYAIAFAGAMLGMSLGVGIGTALGLAGWLSLVLAVALGAGLLMLAMKLKDLAVIVATAAAGGGLVAYGAAGLLPSLFGDPGNYNFLYFLVWIAVAVVGFAVQYGEFKAAHVYGDLMVEPGQELTQ